MSDTKNNLKGQFTFTRESPGVGANLGGEITLSTDGPDWVASYEDGDDRRYEGRARTTDAAILLMLAARLACESAVAEGTCRRIIHGNDSSAESREAGGGGE